MVTINRALSGHQKGISPGSTRLLRAALTGTATSTDDLLERQIDTGIRVRDEVLVPLPHERSVGYLLGVNDAICSNDTRRTSLNGL